MSRNVKEDQTLKENQLLAAQLLALGKTGREAAEVVGVTEETISRWKKTEDFELYTKELVCEAHEAASIRMQNLMEKAVLAIENAIDDQSLTPKEKFTTAAKLIEMCGNYNNLLRGRVHTIKNPPPFFGF
jgi:transcriptional regulator with XRE-family HTH domain